jgi:site-specific DNA recombinase
MYMKNPSIKTEKDLIAEILSGKYRDCHLIYNRKSTDEADNQKNSISYQKIENARFAHREKLSIAQITSKDFLLMALFPKSTQVLLKITT